MRCSPRSQNYVPLIANWQRLLSTGTALQPRSSPRWYAEAKVVPNAVEGEFLVQLDNRSLRTPARHLLAVPSFPLALAIAAEWQWQEGKVRPFTMPLMSLAATAIDQPKPREQVIDTLLRFLHTDAVTCQHDQDNIAERHAQLCQPILKWASTQYGVSFATGNSIFGVEQPNNVEAAMNLFLQVQNIFPRTCHTALKCSAGLTQWELAAVEALSGACKSLLLGGAIFQGKLGVQQALQVARLEENLQLEQWGYVEGGHDLDEADIENRISSAAVFSRLLKKSADSSQQAGA